MRAIEIRHQPTSGPRVYVASYRIHHGTTGVLALIASYLLRPLRPRWRAILAALGLLAVIHDRQDFPFRDCDNH